MIDLTLDSLTVPGIPDYTPPFGTQKDPLVSLSTVETNNNIIKPFTAQRAVEFSHDETLSRIERNAVLVFTGNADAVLDLSNVTTFKGNEIKIVNTTNRALTVKYLEVGEVSYSTMNLTENSATLTADSTTTYSVKVSVESESITTLWSGTKEQFDAIPVKDSNTLYNIIDDVDEELIQDEKISPLSTWSSERIVEEMARAENLLKSPYVDSEADPGILFKRDIKKIVVIGNSITLHGYTEADGISWTVPDKREMAASKPDSGWVTLIKKHLSSLGVNCEIWKGNGSTWEKGTSGSRSFELISNQLAYKVLESGTDSSSETTFEDILTEDVDLILVQLSENMAEPDTDAKRLSDGYDWIQLFGTLRERCPRASIYQFFGFWRNFNKEKVVFSSTADVHVMAPALVDGVYIDGESIDNNQIAHYQAKAGDPIYDSSGTQIATVSSTVAGHPNDAGFLIMAQAFLDALFNDRSPQNTKQRKYFLKSKGGRVNSLEEPCRLSEIFYDPKDDSMRTLDDLNSKFPSIYDHFLGGGVWKATLRYPYMGPRHGIFKVESSGNRADGYNSIVQTWFVTNSGLVDTIRRKTALSASDTQFSPFEMRLDTKEVLFPFGDKSIPSNDWTFVGILPSMQFIQTVNLIIPPINGIDMQPDLQTLRYIIREGGSLHIAAASTVATTPSGSYVKVTYI